MLPGQKSRKAIAATLLLVFFTQTFAPTISYALSSGPTSPEAMSFEPVDTTDLVNLQTGSFVYNLPLIDIPSPEGGYPLSLSYHAGIGTNVDASWVGLGWTLNPGAINRSVNGFPDDWKNLPYSDHIYWSGGQTTTYSAGVNIGKSNSPYNVSFGLSVSSDTYKGFSVGWNLGVGYRSLGTGETTTIGIGMQPYQTTPSVSVGQSNSSVAFGPVSLSEGVNFSTNFNSVQESFSGGIGLGRASVLGGSISSGGANRFSYGSNISTSSSSSKIGSVQTASQGFNATIPLSSLFSVSLGYNKTRYWTDETNTQGACGSFWPTSGFFGQAVYDVYALLDNPSIYNIVDYPDPTVLAGGTYPAFDNYTVLGQGLSGNMRPYGFQQALLEQNHYDDNNNPIVTDNYPAGSYEAGPLGFRFVSDFSNSYRQAADQSQAYPQYSAGTTAAELVTTTPPFSVPAYGNNDGTTGILIPVNGTASRGALEGSRHIDIDYTANPINNAGYTNDQFQQGMFTGFSITNESGVTYHYDLPAYSYGEENYQQRVSTTNGLYFNRGTKTAGYAYAWYLTSITGPDWVDRDGNGVPSAGDWGYWVSFEYGKWSNHYAWRNPAEGYVNDDDNNFEDCSQGYKEVYYLNAIRTRTHIAIFEKDLRQDGKGVTSLTFNKTQQADQNGVVTGTSYTTAGGFDVNSSQSLRLSHIYLLNIADANFVTTGSSTNTSLYSPTNRFIGCTDCELPQNVIDANDVNAVGRYALEAKAIRIIDFNYDYSLCTGTDNSFNIFSANPTPTALEGKLTLNSVVSRGVGGANLVPPTQFKYELTGPDVVSQTNVVFTNATAQSSAYFTGGASNIHVGDMIETTYPTFGVYCGMVTAITPVPGGGGQYTDSLSGGNFNQLVPGGTMNIQTTKNPPYNMNAYDSWGMYKGDADLTLIANNPNMGRNTSAASAAAADAWSLRRIYSPLGDYMKINYQSNTYHTSAMNNTYSYVMQNISPVPGSNNQQISFNLATYGSTANPAALLSINQYLSKILLDVDYSGSGLYCGLGAFKQPVSSVVLGGLTITGVSTNSSIGVTTFTGRLDHPIPNTWYAAFYFGITTGNLWINSTGDYVGGGVRVASISTNHSIDNTFSNIVYNYSSPAGVSSGTTSYLPQGLDAYDITALNSTAGAFYCELTDDVAAYEAALYQNTNALYPIAAELPPPGVMYQYVTVTNQVQNPDESVLRAVPGSTQYQFEVFQPGMVVRDELSPLVWGNENIGRSWVIRKFTSGIGNVKAITQFDNNGLVLSKTINHYLHDNLESQGLTDSNFFTPYRALIQAAPYNYQGFVQERYADVKTINANYKSPTAPPGYGAGIYLGGTHAVLSGREDYPCIQTGQTVISYVNGIQTSTKDLAWDYYSGAVTQSVETDAYGNNIMTETVPAYSSVTGYTAMGLKINNDANKNMLTQVAETRKWKVDANGTKLELISASVNTWTDNSNVIDINGNAYVQNSNNAGGSGDVWRIQSSYDWMSAAQTVTTDGLTAAVNFIDFNWAAPASSNAGWKNSTNSTLYDVYSNNVEGDDISGVYSAVHMDYGDQRIILTGSPAKFYEIAYSGAEDANITQTSGMFVNGGSGTIATGAGVAHTGIQSLLLNAGGTKGFTYSVPTAKLVAARNYEASVWVKPTSGSTSTVGLYYDIDGTVQSSVSTGTAGLAKQGANGFYLLKLFINGSSIVAGHTLNVWVRNDNATVPVWVDDFRFQPQNAGTTAYVYDPKTGQLDYVLDNSNVFTQYSYDAVGNLLQVTKEKLLFPQFAAQQWQYNYGATPYTSSAINNGSYAKNNCYAGGGGIPVSVSVPAGMFNSFISQADADAKAQSYAQDYANTHGACLCQPTFTYASGITPTTQSYTLTGTTTNFTFAFSWPAGFQNPNSIFTLGSINGTCGDPSATRTIPIYLSGTTYDVIVSTTGVVQVELISGPAPATGQVVGLIGTFDLQQNSFYNAATSSTFQRNNCPSGLVGSSYTYTVPLYKYSSVVSQAAANALAQNDVNTNGQNTANLVGTCSPGCGFTFNSGISNQSSGLFSSNGTSVTFSLEFPSPASGWTGGTVGTITGGCLPATNFSMTVTDQNDPSRIWQVTITSAGVVSISLSSAASTAPAKNEEVVIGGTFALSQ